MILRLMEGIWSDPQDYLLLINQRPLGKNQAESPTSGTDMLDLGFVLYPHDRQGDEKHETIFFWPHL